MYTNLRTDTHTYNTKHTHTHTFLSQTTKHGTLLARTSVDWADFTFHRKHTSLTNA
jgi:hypothetical protein